MEKAKDPATTVGTNFNPSKSTLSALARACELLEAGDLADAAKWAAIAASFDESESVAETA